MVTLGPKLKYVKTCQKPMYKHTRVVLCRKPLERTKYSRNETILKIGHLPKAIVHAKAIPLKNVQFESEIKMAKNMRQTVLQED